MQIELPLVGNGNVSRDSNFVLKVLKAYEYECAVALSAGGIGSRPYQVAASLRS